MLGFGYGVGDVTIGCPYIHVFVEIQQDVFPSEEDGAGVVFQTDILPFLNQMERSPQFLKKFSTMFNDTLR